MTLIHVHVLEYNKPRPLMIIILPVVFINFYSLSLLQIATIVIIMLTIFMLTYTFHCTWVSHSQS